MRTAAYNDGTASDHRRRQNVLGHILASAALLSASDARLATTEVKLRRLRHHHCTP